MSNTTNDKRDEAVRCELEAMRFHLRQLTNLLGLSLDMAPKYPTNDLPQRDIPTYFGVSLDRLSEVWSPSYVLDDYVYRRPNPDDPRKWVREYVDHNGETTRTQPADRGTVLEAAQQNISYEGGLGLTFEGDGDHLAQTALRTFVALLEILGDCDAQIIVTLQQPTPSTAK